MVKQSPRLPASNVSANPGLTLELQTSGGPDSSKKKKKKKRERNRKTNRNIGTRLLINHRICVMTSAATLKLNFSEAFKTPAKRKHSHSHEVK